MPGAGSARQLFTSSGVAKWMGAWCVVLRCGVCAGSIHGGAVRWGMPLVMVMGA
jgi:hypothetical protein